MTTCCQQQIRAMLAKYGVMEVCDPRHLEAWIRTEHGGDLPDQLTMAIVVRAIHKVGRNPAADSEVLALSYGL